MAGNSKLNVQMVDLLAVWAGDAKVGDATEEEPVVIVTVRPDPGSFRPHNIGLTSEQAQRLCADLASLFETFSSLGVLLLAILALGFTGGCSARYEARDERTAAPANKSDRPQNEPGAVAAEKSAMLVEVDLLRDNAPASKAPAAAPGAESRATGGPINVSGQTVIIIVPGDGRSGRTGLNTRIGWPSDYLEHGLQAFLGYVAVCLLVGLVITIMIPTCKLESGGPMFLTLALMVLAAILLQTIPAADTGFQFIPLAPWAYSNFLSICVSILCWLAILVAAISAIDGCLDSPTVFSATILFAMAMNVLLSFVGG
jgi:hypothetical protein